VDRVFLDANVLFSAAWPAAPRDLHRLWALPDVDLLTTVYAIREADRNLSESAQRTRLFRLVQRMQIVDEPEPAALPVVLPAKDTPILLAAIQSKATHLLTGDKQHFGQCFGHVVGGVLVLRPSEYLKRHLAANDRQ